MKFKLFLVLLISASLIPLCQGAGYWFNTGDSQGWTYSLTNSSTGVGIRSGTAGWSDINDWPDVWTDPVGDDCGAAQVALWNTDYASASSGDYLKLQFISPDLSTNSSWQSASSFSAYLLPSYTPDVFSPDIYANLYVTVEDLGTGTTRTFVNETATSITEAVWTRKEFDLATTFAGASPPVTNYVLVEVSVAYWIAVDSSHFVIDPLIFDIDNVMTPFNLLHISLRVIYIPDEWGRLLRAMRLEWPSRPEAHYTVQQSLDLRHWQDLADVPSQGPVTTFIHRDISGSKKFYRVRENGNSNGGNDPVANP